MHRHQALKVEVGQAGGLRWAASLRFAFLVLLTSAVTPAQDFSGASALEFTKKIVSFGARTPGSPAMVKQQDWILLNLRRHRIDAQVDRFTASTPKGPMAMANLIARLPGTSGRLIVISGHYDTKILPNFVGANDGGASAGFLLEMARALAARSRRDEIRLVWFDGEEAVVQWTETDSLYGSRRLAAKWTSDGTASRIRALINVDMIGDRDLGILQESNSSQALRQIIWSSAQSLGFGRHFLGLQAPIEDDHMPFLRAGVPAVDLIDFDYGPNHSWWHTPQDTIDKLSASSLEAVGRTLLEAIRRLENQ
jgi:Iap family predicted aminopeptidase